MNHVSRTILGISVAGLLAAGTGVAMAQSQGSSQSQTQSQPQQQTGQQQSGQQSGQSAPPVSATQPIQPSVQQPAPPPPAPAQPAPVAKNGDVPDNNPIQQQDTVHPKNSKDDVNAIGERNVGKGVNFYSLEKEIG